MKKRKLAFLTLISTSLAAAMLFSVGVFAGSVDKNTEIPQTLYSVGERSSYEYGTYTAAEHDPKGYLSQMSNKGGSVTGLKVALAQGDEFRYNKVIDLKDCTKDDILFTAALTPEEVGTEDVKSFNVILTDAYDPENKIIINTLATPDGIGAANGYMKAKTTDQPLTGWEWNYNKKHVEDPYGYPFRINFAGCVNTNALLKSIADNSINFSYDYATKQVHNPVRQSSVNNSVVCDFDDSTHFSNLWEGFTTGECFLSITADSYQKDAANFVITKLFDQDLSDFSFEDEDFGETQISIDFGEYTAETLPVAVQGKPYTLFGATSVSPYFGNLDVTAKVYKNYGTPQQAEVTVDNSRFVPDSVGEYTIEYTVQPPRGNKAVKTLKITAVESTDPISFDFSATDYPEETVAGSVIGIQYPEVSGGSGAKTISVFVSINGDQTEIIDSSYRFEKAGEYTLIFKAVDYCGQVYEESIIIQVAAGNKPVFTDKVALPKYFISGREYVLPSLNAYDYTDGSGRVVASTILFSDCSGVRRAKDNKVIPYARKTGDLAVIEYKAALEGKEEAVYRVEIPVILVTNQDGGLLLDRLLYCPDGGVNSIAANRDGTRVMVEKSGVNVDYVNAMIAQGLSIGFKVPQGGANFQKLSFILTDYADPAVQLKLTYANEGNTVYFYVNGNESAKQKVGQRFGSEDAFGFTYDALSCSVAFDVQQKVSLPVTTTLSGEKFEGFSHEKVNITIVAEDVVGLSAYEILTINNQMLNNEDMEFVSPKISVMGEYGGVKALNERVLLPKAFASDAVDPNAVIFMTVKDEEGNVIRAEDGTLLLDVPCGVDYYIVLDHVSTYKVTYKAMDFSENVSGFSYIIRVLNEKKPTITIEGEVKGCKLGETIYLPAATAKDVNGTELEVFINVVTANGQNILLDGRKFTPKSEGNYTVRYWCMDDSGNMQVEEFSVVVG